MTNKVNPIPEGFHTVTPYLCVKDTAAALEFYQQAFNATELMRLVEPGSGRIGHAEIKIGDSPVMIADEFPEMNILSANSLGGTPVRLSLFVEDADAVIGRAVAAGAQLLRPAADQFYGERSGTIQDPFGHIWLISTQIEPMSAEEMQRRYDEAMR